MNYIAILDYQHLDNALFLKSFAEAIASQEGTRGIILHGDSQYTDRLIQTGMLREDAQHRSVKDLNHRLVSLFADSGVAVVGVNAYQRNMINYNGYSLRFNHDIFAKFPVGTHLLLSNLVNDTRNQKPIAYNLSDLAENLKKEMALDVIIVFSKNDTDEIINHSSRPNVIKLKENESFKEPSVPDDLHKLAVPYRLATIQSFRKVPDLTDTILIDD